MLFSFNSFSFLLKCRLHAPPELTLADHVAQHSHGRAALGAHGIEWRGEVAQHPGDRGAPAADGGALFETKADGIGCFYAYLHMF